MDSEREAAEYAARSLASPQVVELRRRLLAEEPASDTWDASGLTAAALAFRPGIGIAAATARRSASAIRSAEALANPTLALVPELTSNAPAGSSAWSPTALLGWALETAGKRGHRVDQALARARSARCVLTLEVARAHAEIGQALQVHSLLAARVAALSEQASAADEIAELWRKRVEVGSASLAESMPREAVRLDALRAVATQRTAQVDALGAVAAAVGVPVEALRGVQLRAADAVALAPWSGMTSREARERALHSRSDVLGALEDYSAAEASLALEIARQYPDLSIGPGYQWDRGEARWQIGISLELPLLNRNEGPIAEAEAARGEAAARFRETQERAIAQVELAVARRDGLSAERDPVHVLAAEREREAARAERAVVLGSGTRVDGLAVRLEALRAEQAETEVEASWRGALIELAAAVEAVPFQREPLEAWIDEQVR